MKSERDIFEFYVKRYKIELINQFKYTEDDIDFFEKKNNKKIDKILRETILFLGDNIYFSKNTGIGASDHFGIFDFWTMIDRNYRNYRNSKDFCTEGENDRSLVDRIEKNGELFVLNQAYSGDQYYIINMLNINSGIFLTRNNRLKPYYSSLREYIIRGLQNRFLFKYNNMSRKVRFGDPSSDIERTRFNERFLMTKDELEKSKFVLKNMKKIIDEDEISFT